MTDVEQKLGKELTGHAGSVTRSWPFRMLLGYPILRKQTNTADWYVGASDVADSLRLTTQDILLHKRCVSDHAENFLLDERLTTHR